MRKKLIKTISLVLIVTIISGTFGVLMNEESFAAKKIPVKKIKLTKKSIILNEGKTTKLKLKYIPKTTTVKKKVKWRSSKPSIATVKNGVVKAKKVGTTIITAKVGKKTAKCKIKVKTKTNENKNNNNYVDATYAYKYLNAFRTQPNIWYWSSDDITKIYFNKNGENTLKSLTRNKNLENTAKIRAKEISKKFSHIRPDGRDCFTAYPHNLKAYGENLAAGTSLTAKESIDLLKETNCGYSEQNHRRNMLDKHYNSVGIAGYKKNGMIYWAQCFGNV